MHSRQKQVKTKVSQSRYTREATPEIDINFKHENEALIKNLLIDEIIKENQFINYCQFVEDGKYNLQDCTVKGSRKYKGTY